jgi:sarcosine oxidase subunit alpha
MSRLPAAPTQRIRRKEKVSFTYLGQPYEGFAGDTVASALWAEGVRVFSRSLKYHRPRGLYSLDGECTNSTVTIDGLPNERAETRLLKDGMAVTAQNVKGSPDRDAYGVIDRFDHWMPAGFYYKIFHKPYSWWPFFQNRIRRMAGLGEVNLDEEHQSRAAELYLNVEVAVIGGGPAGLNAALAAADRGVRVALFEQRPQLGGFYDWRVRPFRGQPLYERARDLALQAASRPGLRVFTHAPVTGVWGDNLVTGFQVGHESDPFDERYFECRAQSIIVATGCGERPLVFENNDRPGVMQVGCAWRLARTYGVLPGQRSVFSVGDDLGLEAALDLASLGLEVLAVADARATGHDPELVAALGAANIEFLPGWAAHRVKGQKRVTAVELQPLSGADRRVLACDLVVANAGPQAVIGPLSTAKAKLRYDDHTGLFQPATLPPRLEAVGRMGGYVDPRAIEASGRLAALEALAEQGLSVERELGQARAELDDAPPPARGCNVVHGPNVGAGRKAFICLDEDGTYKTASQSAAQGFDQPELAKRFGGFGLGPGQYQVPGQNLAMTMACLTDTPLSECQGTVVRPPLVPPLIGTYAGHHAHIYKRTPLHQDQAKRGGIFRQIGVWKRARYFSDDLTCRHEIENVRTKVGLIDVSTLGKFRLFGPDARKALQRVYISNMNRIKPGRCKYSAMCNDTGNLVDDGVVVATGEGDYYFTTSSARAGVTVEWFRYHCRDEDWDFHLVNLTDALGAINLAGPRAREVLARVTTADVSNEAFPYMGYRELELTGGVVARCTRLGFVGELSYELHVPASMTQYVWDLLWEAGQEFGLEPFGLEAQSCLRAEKGHIIIGAESEQRVTLLDLGLGFLWAKKDRASKKVGAPALKACADQAGRLKLVGFKLDDGQEPPHDGAVIHEQQDIAGFVCTTRYSHSLGYQYGMALVRDDLAKSGGSINIYEKLSGEPRRSSATIVSRHFYDPDGLRLTA